MRACSETNPVSQEELEKVKQQQIAELPGSHETMNSIGGLLGDLLQLQLPLDYYDSYVSRVSSLSLTDIESCAKSLLEPNQFVWLVVGDRASLEPGLRALNIGEIIPTEA